jgi:hypothetical protein
MRPWPVLNQLPKLVLKWAQKNYQLKNYQLKNYQLKNQKHQPQAAKVHWVEHVDKCA